MGESEREAAAAATSTAPSIDQVFEILADRRRRYALYYLSTCPTDVATVPELAEGVLSLENRTHGGDEPRRTVRASLQHSHLPKLEDLGVVEHDPRSETVRYWTQPSVEEWLEHAYHTELPQRTRAEFERE